MSNRAFKSLVSLAVLVAVVVSTAFGFCPAKQIYASASKSTTFDKGVNLRAKMLWLAGSLSNIHGFLKADVDSLNENANFIDEDHIFSAEGEQYPIYGWYKNGNIYYYTPADNIYLNEDTSVMFMECDNLTNISGLAHVNTSKVIELDSIFLGCKSLRDISPLSAWKFSKLNNLDGLVMYSNVEEAICLNGWDVSKVDKGHFSHAFEGTPAEAYNRLPYWFPFRSK